MAAVKFNTEVTAGTPGRSVLPDYDSYMKMAKGANPLSAVLNAYSGYKSEEAMKNAIADPINADTSWLNTEIGRAHV